MRMTGLYYYDVTSAILHAGCTCRAGS